MARTFQINQLFLDLTPLETIGLAVSERLGSGATGGGRSAATTAVTDEIVEMLERIRLPTSCTSAPRPALRQAAPARDRARLRLPAARAAARRAGRRRARGERHELLATIAALPRDVTVLLIEHDMDLVFSSPTASRCWSTARCSSKARPRSRARSARQGGLSRRGRDAELLSIENLSAGYGEAVVLSSISLSLAEGQVLALLGRNGMGKTTLINTIVGVTRRFGGTIALDGPTSPGCGPTSARGPASAGCRRSATSSAR
jgi:ABC-type branched-subunit amino acid transport system ATPase component